MTGVSRVPPGNTFATRLAVAVLLAACLASALVAAMANRLAEGAVQRETVARVSATASAVTARLALQDPSSSGPSSPGPSSSGPSSPGPSSSGPSSSGPSSSGSWTDGDLTRALTIELVGLAAQPEVLGLVVVDQQGTVLVDQAGTQEGTAAVPDATRETRVALAKVARNGSAAARTGRHSSGVAMLTADVPMRLPGRTSALRVQFVADPVIERADQLWRALGVALMLGVAATVGLVFLTGGWGLARRYERALLAAGSDDLTGLGSRRAFRRDLRIQVEHAVRSDLPLTLALIDVNGPEAVNGTVGRRRGDALLLGVGSVLLRAAELVGRPVPAYRIGGDAFALIIPGAGQDDAFTLTDSLRRHIGLDAAPLTANVGLSLLDPQRCPDPETMLIAADAALFEARSLGGNRVVGAGDGGTGLRWVATSGAHDQLAP